MFEAGNQAVAAGRHEEAAALFAACLERAPAQPEALLNRANALQLSGRPKEAIEAYLACVRAAPRLGLAYCGMAEALRQLGLFEQAKAMALEGVAQLPENIDALICLGGKHFDLGEFSEAARVYGEALARSPLHAGVLNNLANALHCLGEVGAALVMHERCYRLEPGNATWRYNLSLTLLAAGDFRRGWAEHEWRGREPVAAEAGPAWRGEDLAGRRILLVAEQGLGDTLQFVRYAPLVAARGAEVVLEVPPELARLVRGMDGVAEVVARGSATPRADMHALLMSLPWLFGTTIETIPATIPYLAPPDALRADWAARVGDEAKLRVGLVWAGGSRPDDINCEVIDRRRSIGDPALLARLAGIGGVRFYNLQKDRTGLPAALEAVDLMGEVTDFADTAALVEQLDLVIAVDTSVAHLAGALGTPVWMLSRRDGCWRWMQDRADSPWYPGMRIYRQTTQGDWAGVLDRVAADLRAFAAAHTPARKPAPRRADPAAAGSAADAGPKTAPALGRATITGAGNAPILGAGNAPILGAGNAPILGGPARVTA
ncbi:unnamed protein product [Acidocella sp. C78]|nr:unnamed protein product [Acidocella sp. C78]